MVLSAVLVIASMACAVSGSGLSLDASLKSDAMAMSGFLVVNCSLDALQTNLELVSSLTLFGSRPYGEEGDLNQLAVIDIWSGIPQLASEFEHANISVEGNIPVDRSMESYLLLSWNYPINMYSFTYSCVADGRDSNNRAVSIATSAMLRSPRDTFNLLNIDENTYDVSDIYKDRVYLISKAAAVFNIEASNAACLTQGGYLVELNDNQETDFVQAFAERVGGTEHFGLGGNDRAEEGKFVYINSGKPVPEDLTWRNANEPNDLNGEDCMEIWVNHGGLNDISCNLRNVKYVCEVPIRCW